MRMWRGHSCPQTYSTAAHGYSLPWILSLPVIVPFSLPPLFPFPSPAPAVVAVAPLAAPPASELRAVNHAAFLILKHLFPSIRTTRINAQCLYHSPIRVHAKRVVAHAELPVLARQFLQPLGDIHVTAPRAILRAQNHVLARVTASAIPIATPATVAPLTTAPAAENRPVNHAVIS